MENTDMDKLRQAYKTAVDQWIGAIREEEALATADHSIVQMERWDAAGFREQDAQEQAKAAKDLYKDALRQVNYSF
jgi:hypothetical protein